MKNNNLTKFHHLYGILLSISIIIAGICLISGCLSIYFSEGHTFSREIVAETFSHIAFPVIACLVLIFGGFFLDIFLPNKEKTKKKAYKPSSNKAFLLEKHSNILRYIFLAAGIILMVYGFITGGTLDVLTKAINICTECIGLG